MLYEFKSKATGTVVMTEPVAERLLAIVGKAAGPRGIFTLEQMGPALAALQAAIDAEAAQGEPETAPDQHEPDDGHDEHDERRPRMPPITLRQRAWPLMDMMRTAQAKGREITWGV